MVAPRSCDMLVCMSGWFNRECTSLGKRGVLRARLGDDAAVLGAVKML